MRRLSGAFAVGLLMFASTAFAAEMLEITAARANMRSGPGTKHDIVTSLTDGEKYEVLDQKGEWVQIMYLVGVKGWIHADLGDIVFTEEKRPEVVKQVEAEQILAPPKRRPGDLSAGMVEFGGGMSMSFVSGSSLLDIEPVIGFFSTREFELEAGLGLLRMGSGSYSQTQLLVIGKGIYNIQTGTSAVPYGFFGLGFVNFSSSYGWGSSYSEGGMLMRFGGGTRLFVTDTWNIRAEIRFDKVFIEYMDMTTNFMFYITGLKAP
jgi:hypothetical protein